MLFVEIRIPSELQGRTYPAVLSDFERIGFYTIGIKLLMLGEGEGQVEQAIYSVRWKMLPARMQVN